MTTGLLLLSIIITNATIKNTCIEKTNPVESLFVMVFLICIMQVRHAGCPWTFVMRRGRDAEENERRVRAGQDHNGRDAVMARDTCPFF